MDATIKEKWVKALRSGEYAQGTSHLQCEGKFCCLGVLGDVVDPTGWRDYEPDEEGYAIPAKLYGLTIAADDEYLPDDVAGRLGLALTDQEALADMNDNGKSFAQIADFIEANL